MNPRTPTCGITPPMTVHNLHPTKANQEQIRVLAATGASPEFIADSLGLLPDTLSLHYQRDLDHGLEEANARVAQTFFHMATSGDFPQLTLSWMKMRAGWTEAPPSQSSSNLTPEEQEQETALSREKLATLLKNRPDVLSKLIATT